MSEKKIVASQPQERPLVTFALFAYNQEQYIREAIEGAFAQTYEPLEIIFSDDCSKDNSYQVAKDVCENYNGSHRLSLQQNRKNLGIGAHLNKIFNQASGELIVLAAADDISKPERVDEIVKFWIDSNRKYDSIWSSVILIDMSGKCLGHKSQDISKASIVDQISNFVPSVLGCSHAITKRLHKKFGALNANIVYEDRVLAFRSLISGGHGYINKPLVKYRVHNQSISAQFRASSNSTNALEKLEKYRLHLLRNDAVLNQYRIDTGKLSFSSENFKLIEDINKAIDKKSEWLSSEILLQSDYMADRVRGFFFYHQLFSNSYRKTLRRLMALINPLIPFRLL